MNSTNQIQRTLRRFFCARPAFNAVPPNQGGRKVGDNSSGGNSRAVKARTFSRHPRKDATGTRDGHAGDKIQALSEPTLNLGLDDAYTIANNHGHVNGVIRRNAIFGKVARVEK